MSPMRRTINLFLALLLSFLGLGSLTYLVLSAAGWKGWMVISSALVAFSGLAWLWEDYFHPDKMER